MKNRQLSKLSKPHGYIYGAKWGNVPVEARVCLVTVGISPPNWWSHKHVGSERSAIEVKLPGTPDSPQGQIAYVDNEAGWALKVFLRGLAPLPKFRFVPVFFVKDDPASDRTYHVTFEGARF